MNKSNASQEKFGHPNPWTSKDTKAERKRVNQVWGQGELFGLPLKSLDALFWVIRRKALVMSPTISDLIHKQSKQEGCKWYILFDKASCAILDNASIHFIMWHMLRQTEQILWCCSLQMGDPEWLFESVFQPLLHATNLMFFLLWLSWHVFNCWFLEITAGCHKP